VKWREVIWGSEGVHYFEMVVLLFNSVIYVSLLLCLCILIICLCNFIVMYVLYSVSLCCLCVNVYRTTATGCQPNCS